MINKANNCRSEVIAKTEVSPVVVLCKDCVYWEKQQREDGFCFNRYVSCGSLTPRREPTDFCSYGEPENQTYNG